MRISIPFKNRFPQAPGFYSGRIACGDCHHQCAGRGRLSDGEKNALQDRRQQVRPRFVIMIETIGGSPFIRTPAEYNSQVRPLTVAGKMRHAKGGVNMLFGDFSVKTMTWKDIEKSAIAWTTFWSGNQLRAGRNFRHRTNPAGSRRGVSSQRRGTACGDGEGRGRPC